MEDQAAGLRPEAEPPEHPERVWRNGPVLAGQGQVDEVSTYRTGPFAHTRPGGSGCSALSAWIRRLAADSLLYATKDRGPVSTLEAVRAAYNDDDASLMAAWSVAAQLSDLEWCICDVCDTPRLTKPSVANPGRCTLTAEVQTRYGPRCSGFLQRVAKRPILTADLRQALLFPRNGPD